MGSPTHLVRGVLLVSTRSPVALGLTPREYVPQGEPAGPQARKFRHLSQRTGGDASAPRSLWSEAAEARELAPRYGSNRENTQQMSGRARSAIHARSELRTGYAPSTNGRQTGAPLNLARRAVRTGLEDAAARDSGARDDRLRVSGYPLLDSREIAGGAALVA